MTILMRTWRAVYNGWMRFAHVLGIVNTTILLTLVYLLIVLPTRALWWVIRKDPLMIRRPADTPTWLPREQDAPSLDERRHPF